MYFWLSAARFQKLPLRMACAERLLNLASDVDEKGTGKKKPPEHFRRGTFGNKCRCCVAEDHAAAAPTSLETTSAVVRMACA